MSFYISLSGLQGAQADLAGIANNVANVGSTGFKKSVVSFGDIFAASPMQSTSAVGGQGVRLLGATQQFTQGTLETTGKTLDVAITGEGFFTTKTPAPDNKLSFTRNGALGIDQDRNVVDSLGARIQVMPTDASGKPTSTDQADLFALQIPTAKPSDPTVQLASVGVAINGLVTATYTDGTTENLGVLAIASFPSQEGLRQQGNGHWTSTNASGPPTYGAGNSGLFGAIQSGSLERSNVDLTSELVALIAAQRNFQANAKAIEASSTMTSAVINMRT